MKLIPHILLLLATLSHAADETALRAAIEKSLPLLERSSAIAIQERSNCFTCHHSGLPVMTFLTAQKRGFPVDEVNLKSQLQFTADVLAEGRERYLEGKGQGGAAFMAGSALWTMKLGKWKADANTDAVVEYLLEHQKDLNHWKPPSIRPPSEESPFSATFFALEGILHFASEAQKPRMIVRVKSALEWLEKTAPQTTEDRIFRLQALRAAGGNVDRSVADLLAIQRDDGGWAQLETMGTDAYATATALVALHRAGGLPVADEKYQRGIAWLIDAQLPDGSWHVVSRSKPIQKYFESGYPHGKDQFISITAASWATTALLDALGPVPQDIVFKAAVDGSEQRYVELMPPGYDPAKVHDVVLAFHGHGSDRWQFIKDERGECRGVRNAASKYGQILVSPDYRAKTSWMGPAAEADVVQIIAELRQRHRIGRIFLAGGSMGGTAVLTFTALHPELVAGVCSLNGTANLVEYENFQEARTASFGGTIAEVPEEYRKRSAEFFPDKFTMPVAFTTGGKDKSVPPQSVLRLAEALKQAKRKVLSLHREEGGHSTSYEDTILAMEFMLREAGSLPASERVAYFEKAEALQDRLVNAPEDLRADADLFAKGMNWALRYDTALQPSDLALIKKAAVRGDERAEAILSKKPPWTTKKGKVVRGFISAIDGSTQPYGVIVPKGYDGTKPFRLDVVLHGSSKPVGMSELKFIQRFDEGDLGDSTAPDVDYIELHPLGRVENCYRWAGETDVFEAIEAACRNYRIDRDRIVLRGMSMGASGTWHLGLKHPDRFVAIGPYCGYVDTHRFSETPIPNFIKVGPLPPHQEIALHMLDSVDYAANAGVVPAIAAIGDKDVFFQSHVHMGEAFAKEGIPFVNLISPGTGHVIDPKTHAEQMRRIGDHAAKGLDHDPREIRFVTWTLKYNRCHWLELRGLGKHYERAEFRASVTDDHLSVAEVRNITRFVIHRPVKGMDVTGVEIALPSHQAGESLVFSRSGDTWKCEGPLTEIIVTGKRPGLQGPIDDAFATPFLCVRGTGTPWNPKVNAWAEASLRRFEYEWARYMRGDLPVKNDTEVTEADVRDKHLILFGDPGSNSWIAKALPKLPVTWTRDEVSLGGLTKPSKDHAPAFICESPLAADRYLVINSGHTFHEEEFAAFNYLLFPRMGDWALVKTGHTEEVLRAGYFDEAWLNASMVEPQSITP